ncbi:MAG: chemotaxis protein [Lysinibacillus sp.]|nr:chemotaxis protein [Lysinibacillus sp.]
MNKEQLIALGLTEEQADKVIAGFGAMIPKSRFDEVNQAKKDLEKQIADRDKQLEELKKIDAEGLQAKITELQQVNETAKKEFEAKLKETQLTSALKLALAGKVHDADLVASLIDKEKIELDENGNIAKGLEEQIKSLQESKSFLFVPEKEPNKPKFNGVIPPENPNGTESPIDIGADYAKMLNERGKAPENSNNPWG